MKVVIDIDEKLYGELKAISKEEWSDERLGTYQWIIVNGTPLPKICDGCGAYMRGTTADFVQRCIDFLESEEI